jgi:hypothetical protein
MTEATTNGQLPRAVGVNGRRSDTGVRADDASCKKVTDGGGPSNLRTDIAVAPSSEIFISEGYGNARVHKFSADCEDLFSWGARVTGRASSTCRTGRGSTGADGCWSPTERKAGCRSSTRTATY